MDLLGTHHRFWANSEQSKLELRRLEDIHCQRYIISVDLVEHGTALAITHDDSSIALYDTRTMAVFNGLDDASTVTCLGQAGFQYPMDMPGTFAPTCHISLGDHHNSFT